MRHCTDCHRPMRGSRTPASHAPGTVAFGGNGRCKTCAAHARGDVRRRPEPGEREQPKQICPRCGIPRTINTARHATSELCRDCIDVTSDLNELEAWAA